MTQTLPPANDARRYAPATLRNREPIREVLAGVLPACGRVLEVASGTGEHIVFFATAFPGITWQPSDADPESLASIAAWAAEAALANLGVTLHLDASRQPWPPEVGTDLDVVLCINMIHIAPWTACQGLMAGAAAALKTDGALVLYGPFKAGGRHTAPSNAAFDDQLRAMDPRYGVRDVCDVEAEAAARGLLLERQVAMPANNLTLVFRKQATLP